MNEMSTNRISMVESMGEGVDEGLQLIDSMRQIVGCIELISPGRLGAFDAAVEVGALRRQHEEFQPARLAFGFEDGFELGSAIDLNAPDGEGRLGLCRLDPDFPIKDKIVLADKDGSTEPQFADRAHEFPHMSRSALADFTCRQLQIVKSNAYEFELGQSVVPRYVRCRRCLRELQELFAPMAAFPLQLTLNSVLVNEEIMTTPGHSSNLLPANSQARREP
jgi:hypothetical protein